ncbi:glycosyl transferase family protein [Gymnodinialimonas sp. 2305UL16-5]|uniref:glycosyl transferase family protein n=1 Tax=Gymnodinialimonas mytili TaxID=3126503 RepID=UPI0030A0E7AF
MSLSDHVRTLGRGPGRSRSLTRNEAEDAMALMLSGKAAPEAVGALLMLLRMKGETAEEIAGLAHGAQANLPELGHVDLDWPSYAAGRTRGLPWFLLSAKLVAMAGHSVLIHGFNGPDAAVRAGVAALGIGGEGNLRYRALETLSPDLFRLLRLRDVLGLRSCVNTICRMLNPGRAKASVQGVFHPSYRMLQADAAQVLGWDSLSVIKGGGGEFECNPSKDVAGFGLRAGAHWQATRAASIATPRRLADDSDMSALPALWNGARSDPFAEQIVLATATLALDTLGDATPDTTAHRLWANRASELAA